MSFFKNRSLCTIDDLSTDERKWFFSKVKELKEAILKGDEKTLSAFRIDDKDYGIYEVFLEDSTRTKESFRNAAFFHHAKVSELISLTSSINKGESFKDTFNMLTGYQNSIFIVRSKIEGLTRYLSEEAEKYAERNNLNYKASFINAGDGKHEHPTQELLDEFSFLEELDMSYEKIHIALVGDLYHGRTVHSKVDGLKIFDSVTVDLVAPEELMIGDNYITQMRENGYSVNTFSSIEEYIRKGKVAFLWYFTRPQLERMGDKILKKADVLREAITFKREFMEEIDERTRFFHPLPRHKEHPTIPTFLDSTPFNAWETQAINGMYVRITLLSMIAGKIGHDFVEKKCVEEEKDEDYIIKVEKKEAKEKPIYAEGVNPIKNGICIDHIAKGESPEEIRSQMRMLSKILSLDDGKGGDWVSKGSDGRYKGIIFRPERTSFERKDLKRLASASPGCTLNIIENSAIKEKYRTKMPPRIYNFEDLRCKNEDCISAPESGEKTGAFFYRTKDGKFKCKYCGRVHTFKEIWDLKRKN